MNKPNIQEVKNAAIVWQGCPDEEIPEPAILIRRWSGGALIEIQREDHCININRETIPELCRLLKRMSEPDAEA